MFGKARRSVMAQAGVRFCDSCAQVSTANQRAERRYDRVRAGVHTLISPR
ncbi:hypothetical protein ACGFJ5_28615 [Micromonospora echinaurantiaca]